VPISFSIEPTSGLLRTVVTGRVGRDDMVAYARELRDHPAFELVERRLVDVRPSALVTADDLHDARARARRGGKRAPRRSPSDPAPLGDGPRAGSRARGDRPTPLRCPDRLPCLPVDDARIPVPPRGATACRSRARDASTISTRPLRRLTSALRHLVDETEFLSRHGRRFVSLSAPTIHTYSDTAARNFRVKHDPARAPWSHHLL
jgi:hypothetical protein